MMQRSGLIAAMAMFAIAILSAVTVAVLFNASEETQITSVSRFEQQAEAFGEQLAVGAVDAWPCDNCDQIAVGSVFIAQAQSAPPLEGTIYVTRLDSALYLVTGEGRVKTPAGVLARRRISVTATARRDSIGAISAARTRGIYWTANYSM